jgi:DNA-binding SARP family transcriptional activator/Tfp pilus assembly protein PilF
MASATEFRLLGPLEVRRAGLVIPVQPGKQRTVLAALLLKGDRVVSLEELAEVLWGPARPPSERATIRNYIKRLRRALGDAGCDRIRTEPHGYLISLDADELDVNRFEALRATAHAASRNGSWETAAAQARAALTLWRGEPLADVDSEVLAAREMPRLVESRLQVLETRITADVYLGRHADVITELLSLAEANPLREQLHALLMLALYRSGRQAEALSAYQQVRRILVAEVGAEPGARLRRLHQQILIGDPALDAPPPATAVRSLAVGGRPDDPSPVTPRELPACTAHFAGRTEELAALTGLLDRPAGQVPGAIVISAIGGTAGVGKTALAVQWAHRVAARFPDGQLYVDLRGYDPGHPMRATDALAGFLRALGVPGRDIPPVEAERAARYRSLLAGRRMLVVLDNAGEVEQVRPLLPGGSACAVVVTSRRALAGLVARDGAQRLDLDLLPPGDAIGLLRALIGARVDAEPAAASALAEHCCRLPLALRIAAEFAAAHPDVPLTELAGELADQQRRLDLLDAGGDPRTAVREVFSWSCRHLDADTVRSFRLLGLHPGPDFDACAAAALAAATIEDAHRRLDQLARAHLIQPAGTDRYTMHDLLRAYAREFSEAEDTEEERQAALTRLFDYYLYTVGAAMDFLFPAEIHRRPRLPGPTIPASSVSDPAAARAWLDAQRANLVAVAAHTAGNGWPHHTTRLAAILFRYLHAGGHYPEAVTIDGHACRAARLSGDSAAGATALTRLGLVYFRQGCYQQATGRLQESLALHRQTGDRTGQARALSNLGLAEFQQGRCQQAAGYFQQALALHRQTGDRIGEAGVLCNLGYADQRQGNLEQANFHLCQALAVSRQTGDPAGQARALGHLGLVNLRQGRHRQASVRFREALNLFRDIGERSGQAYNLANLGLVRLGQGNYQQAVGHYREALALFREFGDRSGEADALNGIGAILLAIGRTEDARVHHDTALSLASHIGDLDQQARAHDGLGHACHAAGDLDEAHRHWQQALAIYTELGVPEADQVRAQLAPAANGRRQER